RELGHVRQDDPHHLAGDMPGARQAARGRRELAPQLAAGRRAARPGPHQRGLRPESLRVAQDERRERSLRQLDHPGHRQYTSAAMGTSHVTLDEAAVMTVGQVMISRPKTLPATATVADARRLFENQSVRTALVAEEGVYAGERPRPDIEGRDDAAPIAAVASTPAGTVAKDA